MMKRDICIDRLEKRAIYHKDENAYFTLINDTWVPITWHDYHEQVIQFANALINFGFLAEEKLAILGSNQLEWVISSIGTQYAHGISVGIYSSSSAEEVSYVVNHSDASILVVENLYKYRKQVKAIRSSLSKVKLIILMSNEASDEEDMIGFSQFMAKGKKANDELIVRQKNIDAHDPAAMIYTSGTTGHPKSVLLSHASIAWTVKAAVQSWQCRSSDKAVSYLPLAHIAEQMFTLYAPIECGMQCYFAPSMEGLRDTLRDVQPTVFFGVPRVYEKIYETISGEFNKQGKIINEVIKFISNVANNYHRATYLGKIPSLLDGFFYQYAAKKILLKIKQKIGLANARICVCGAAPVSKDILWFFSGLDLPIYEIYGQTENCGPASFNLPGQAKIGSAGRVVPGSLIKIADDGEILIKGPHVFLGYYKDEQATREVLKDGWLYSGDIGNIDNDGYLFITDRKKDLLITAGGKNISPQNLESLLKHLPYVQSAVVIGDAKKFLCALLSPDIDRIKKKALDMGKSPADINNLLKEPVIHQEIKQELALINNRLSPVEQIKKYSLLPNEFSIDSGEFTPTMKVKRKFINKKYESIIEKMYNDNATLSDHS